MLNRRLFISGGIGIVGANYLLDWKKYSDIKYSISYVGMKEGHFIRDFYKNQNNFNVEDSKEKYDVIVVGSGIAGLTAIWKLLKENYKGKIALIVGPEKFGNSSFTEIDGVKYPNGAHYLPLPTMESTHVREILKDLTIIKEQEYDNYPVYDEKHLVYGNKERMLYENEWVDSINIHSEDLDKFTNLINDYKNKVGKDGKKLFAIPVEKSSIDLVVLDTLTFSDWLNVNSLNDISLKNYLNYCTKDEYGVTIDSISAWAGIHYFSARTGNIKDYKADTFMTWVGGNSYLATSLFNKIKDKIKILDGYALKIENKSVFYIDKDNKNNLVKTVEFDKLVLATPLHMTKVLLGNSIKEKMNSFVPNYSMWSISHVKYEYLPYDKFKGLELAYDNVIYGSDNLGYIYPENQEKYIDRKNKILITYSAIGTEDINKNRKELSKYHNTSSNKDFDLVKKSLNDLNKAYNGLGDIKEVKTQIRGHAMCYPKVGFLTNNFNLKKINNDLWEHKIILAHSDLSGISIFEEASYWGYYAAMKILK